MTCKEATELMTSAHLRRISLREILTLKVHVFLCKGCKNFAQQLKVIREAIVHETNNIPGKDVIDAIELRIREGTKS